MVTIPIQGHVILSQSSSQQTRSSTSTHSSSEVRGRGRNMTNNLHELRHLVLLQEEEASGSNGSDED